MQNEQDNDAAVRIDGPRPWEEESTFGEMLYDWMERAPWMGISLAAHALVFLIFQAIPWDAFREEPERVFQVQSPPPPVEDFEEEIEIEEPEEPELPPIEEPTLSDVDITEESDPVDVVTDDRAPSDSEIFADTPFLSDAFNELLGIGGGTGGGGHFGNRGDGPGKGGSGGTNLSVRAGLDWLAAHQDDDGKWDADGFMKHDPANDACNGAGHATQDVGLTALALLAFLGDGNTPNEGPYKAVVAKGITWLRDNQDPDSGLFGQAASHDFLYGHAIATLAICETYYFTRSPVLRGNAQRAANFIARARNPYGAWRYDVPAIGDNDTSITGWMVFALASAKDAGLVVDDAAFDGALSWLDEVSDPATGRCGYDSFGSLSSRTPANERYPREKGEAMTAVALLCRFFLGQDPDDEPIMEKHADLLQRTLPEWDPEGLGCDMYAWYYGSYAMFQMGGTHWKNWNRAMKRAVVDSQRRDGAAGGSWDPVGPWGYSGGRVYSTAMMVLCLEVYFRYAKVLGAR